MLICHCNEAIEDTGDCFRGGNGAQPEDRSAQAIKSSSSIGPGFEKITKNAAQRSSACGRGAAASAIVEQYYQQQKPGICFEKDINLVSFSITRY
jgi:hypothetical protein